MNALAQSNGEVTREKAGAADILSSAKGSRARDLKLFLNTFREYYENRYLRINQMVPINVLCTVVIQHRNTTRT